MKTTVANKPFYAEQMGMWIISSYSDVVTVLKNVDVFEPIASYEVMLKKLNMCDQAISIMNEIVPLSTNRIATSPKLEHDRLKDAVKKSFSYKYIQAFEQAIEKIVINKLEQFPSSGFIDLVEYYSKHISMESVLTFLGVPAEDFSALNKWHQDITRLFFLRMNEQEQIQAASSLRNLKEYLSRLFISKQVSSGVICELASAYESSNLAISYHEVIQLLCDIISAGFDTTLNAMNWAFYRLIANPSLWAEIANAPMNTIEQYVDETLRLNTAQMGLVRLVTADTIIGDINIPKNSVLYVLHTHANRDPSIFPNPDQIQIGKETSKQLTFGYGMHYCLGAQLAKSEIKIAIKNLNQRFPRLNLHKDGVSIAKSGVINVIKKLEVVNIGS